MTIITHRRYYRLEGHEAVPVANVEEWTRVFDEDNRVVAQDMIGDVQVSTVFLGLDHQFLCGGPPLIFETMIFGGAHDEFQKRYSTWDEAERGHAAALRLASE